MAGQEWCWNSSACCARAVSISVSRGTGGFGGRRAVHRAAHRGARGAAPRDRRPSATGCSSRRRRSAGSRVRRPRWWPPRMSPTSRTSKAMKLLASAPLEDVTQSVRNQRAVVVRIAGPSFGQHTRGARRRRPPRARTSLLHSRRLWWSVVANGDQHENLAPRWVRGGGRSAANTAAPRRRGTSTGSLRRRSPRATLQTRGDRPRWHLSGPPSGPRRPRGVSSPSCDWPEWRGQRPTRGPSAVSRLTVGPSHPEMIFSKRESTISAGS